jgi:hypothetical protein
VPSADGKGPIEIPEHMVPGRTSSGSPSRNWEIVQTGIGKGDHKDEFRQKTSSNHSRKRSQSLTARKYQYSHANFDDEDGADGPVIGYTRSESRASHSRVNSRTSLHTPKSSMTKNTLEPILSSKREYISKDGHPKAEYVWRHPPVFERATGRTQPIYIGAGLGDLSSSKPKTTPRNSNYVYEGDNDGVDFGAMRTPTKSEEGLLFRDSGYGSGGMLPGLTEQTPLAGMLGEPRYILEDDEVIRLGKVVNEEGFRKGKGRENLEGEATKSLRRMKKNKTSSGTTSIADTVWPNRDSAEIMEEGVERLSMRG